LPEDKPPILDSFWEGKESYFVKYEMLFFHYGTMQSFLVRLGNMQLDALIEVELWQYGILFKYNENTYALVEAKPDDKQIIVRVSGQDDEGLLNKILNLLEKIQGKEGITITYSNDGVNFKDSKEKLQKRFDRNEVITFNTAEEIKKGFYDLKKEFNEMKPKVDEILSLGKENLAVSKDTLAGVELLLEEFSNQFLEIKKDISKAEEERIKLLEKLIDKQKPQNLIHYQQKAQIAFPKFSSLQIDSQTFIAMGFYFLEILPDNGDFSPAALQFCRALELEMKVVFMNFKNSQFRHLESYPNHNNFTYTKFQGFVNENKGLALGDMVHIISDISIHQSRPLFSDFGNFMSNWKTNNDLTQFLTEVHIFKTGPTSPRNKSAHTSPLPKVEAETCKEKVLRALDLWLA
jgi:hypothetical protein